MKIGFIGLVTCLFVGSYQLGFSSEAASEKGDMEGMKAHLQTAHKHGPHCGHTSVTHGNHLDYIHEGVYHAAHQDHYDAHGMVAMKAGSSREIASTFHQALENHPHQHGPKCGHKAIQHGDHMDYLHDGHYHTAHLDHFDDHGIM